MSGIELGIMRQGLTKNKRSRIGMKNRNNFSLHVLDPKVPKNQIPMKTEELDFLRNWEAEVPCSQQFPRPFKNGT